MAGSGGDGGSDDSGSDDSGSDGSSAGDGGAGGDSGSDGSSAGDGGSDDSGSDGGARVRADRAAAAPMGVTEVMAGLEATADRAVAVVTRVVVRTGMTARPE